MTNPNPGSIWRHTSGAVYEVLLLANEEADDPQKWPTTVVYQGLVSRKVWARRLSGWHRSFQPHQSEAA